MPRRFVCLVLSVAIYFVPCLARAAEHEASTEITDPAEAAKDPDFLIQGEYAGDGTWLDGEQTKAGAQVVALGKGQFDLVVLKGGLPGDGWKRGHAQFALTGNRQGDATELGGISGTGKVSGDTMTIAGRNGKAKLQLKRTVRHSPTEGAKPPAGAIVLFDGTSADNFVKGQINSSKNLMVDTETKQGFGDHALHLEMRMPYMPEARGQARGNSGLYLHNCYEMQILDSFGLEGKDNECGGFYQVREPDVNMCLPPLAWQTYDVEFTAPKYQENKKVANARVTVKQNGVVIHPDFELPKNTPGRLEEGPAPRPFWLQQHGNKVEFRNIWVVEKK